MNLLDRNIKNYDLHNTKGDDAVIHFDEKNPIIYMCTM